MFDIVLTMFSCTNIICRCLPTAPKCSYIPPRETYIKVLPPSDPVITLSGSQLKSFPESDVLSRELYLFDDIKIFSEAKNNLKQGLNKVFVLGLGAREGKLGNTGKLQLLSDFAYMISCFTCFKQLYC